ncbi:MAG TPA: hypothetical protein VGC41_22655 [Kofleriaceae bacterium]
MQDFRGVMADAECPRCNTKAPPPEGMLATCKRCGLVFTPHEIQHRVRPRETTEEVAPKPLPQPPSGVTARREGSAIVIAWPVARYVAVFLLSLALFLAWFASNFYMPVWTGVFIAGLSALVQLFAAHVITLDGDHVSHHIAFSIAPTKRLSLEWVTSLELRKGRLAMWELHLVSKLDGRPTLLARSIDQNPLAYAAAIIAEFMEA